METEQERRTVLDDTAPELPTVGPDTRYMAWAGVVGVEVLRADSDRIVGAHLRDTVGMNMNQGDVPSPLLRECHLTAYDRGTANPQLGN